MHRGMRAPPSVALVLVVWFDGPRTVLSSPNLPDEQEGSRRDAA